MTGLSSTWYAIDASFRSSRNSAARSEELKEILRGVDDRVRLLALEALAIVDAPPRNGDGEHPGRLGGPHVERRVADIGCRRRIDAHALCGEQQRLRVGLVLLRLVAADDGLEEM